MLQGSPMLVCQHRSARSRRSASVRRGGSPSWRPDGMAGSCSCCTLCCPSPESSLLLQTPSGNALAWTSVLCAPSSSGHSSQSRRPSWPCMVWGQHEPGMHVNSTCHSGHPLSCCPNGNILLWLACSAGAQLLKVNPS